MQFNYAFPNSSEGIDGIEPPADVSLELDVPYGHPKPAIQAQGNVTYRGFIRLVEMLWTNSHPEIMFVPYGGNQIYDPEKGYIVYSLVRSRPAENYIKPRFHTMADHPSDPDIKMAIFIQSFVNMIKFSAIHTDPRVAEEIIENFELFILEFTPLFYKYGVEDCVYGERPSDEHKGRYGEDVAVRSVIFVVRTQKIFKSDLQRLDQVAISVSAAMNRQLTAYEHATPNSHNIDLTILDTYSSDNEENEL